MEIYRVFTLSRLQSSRSHFADFSAEMFFEKPNLSKKAKVGTHGIFWQTWKVKFHHFYDWKWRAFVLGSMNNKKLSKSFQRTSEKLFQTKIRFYFEWGFPFRQMAANAPIQRRIETKQTSNESEALTIHLTTINSKWEPSTSSDCKTRLNLRHFSTLNASNFKPSRQGCYSVPMPTHN